jgi:hypothetical protein
MWWRVCVLVAMAASCECLYVYSSFWAPLFNPRILNYRVDTAFDPETRGYRDAYEKNYGFRGERLIEDLGNGKGPGDVPLDKVSAYIKRRRWKKKQLFITHKYFEWRHLKTPLF